MWDKVDYWHESGTEERINLARKQKPDVVSYAIRGTTTRGYRNESGQVVVRNTGRRRGDMGQVVYELRCTRCGNKYGASGTEIYHRKCPQCQGGKPGLPVSD